MSEQTTYNTHLITRPIAYTYNIAKQTAYGALGGMAVHLLSNPSNYYSYYACQSHRYLGHPSYIIAAFVAQAALPVTDALENYIGPRNDNSNRYSLISKKDSEGLQLLGGITSLFLQLFIIKSISSQLGCNMSYSETVMKGFVIPSIVKGVLNEMIGSAYAGGTTINGSKITLAPEAVKDSLSEPTYPTIKADWEEKIATPSFSKIRENTLKDLHETILNLKISLEELINLVDENPSFRANLGNWLGRSSSDNQTLDRLIREAFLEESLIKTSVSEILKIIEKGLIQSGLARQVGDEFMIPKFISGEPNLVLESYNNTVETYNKFIELYDSRRKLFQ